MVAQVRHLDTKTNAMDFGGNSRPLATQPPTKASAQWKDLPNVGKYDELQRLIIIPNGLGAWRYWKKVPLNIRERMFDDFRMKCAWSIEHEAKIRETFFRKCSRRLSYLLWYA
ncbi:hypothetical protein H5410_036398 [Solanum commersonii]|uniref:Uncharacterized protein n=1 Tax=Solanum commersonii TaxID=4109 RepID=A0A9J5Y814_SOLCO|nr:hypothetical protein H5410_036398 [Solanum commersonii]